MPKININFLFICDILLSVSYFRSLLVYFSYVRVLSLLIALMAVLSVINNKKPNLN